MLLLRKFVTTTAFKRYFGNVATPTYILERLNTKSLITLVGEESPTFLQGLITNDIRHFNNSSSLYTMFLNSKGRVLYDTIIYQFDAKTYFVECDNSLIQSLQKHIQVYKLRRKIDVFLNNYNIHVLFDKQHYDEVLENKASTKKLEQNSEINLSALTEIPNIKLFKDPRLSQLGYRILSPETTNVYSEISRLSDIHIDNTSESNYRKYRYSLGIGEGASELPSGSCFPLESNCDYLHGVSFHKGCYVGQELTARTYHTGVTRKRIMPLFFNKPLNVPEKQDLISVDNVKLGKLRGIEGNVGIALVRIELAEKNSNIIVAGTEGVVVKPFWWPVEVPKDKVQLEK